MTRQGSYLWYYDQTSNYVGKTTTGGSLLANFIPSDNTLRDLCWDGTHLWTMNISGEIKKYTTSGVLEETVTDLLPRGWGITFDGSHLWASDPQTDKIYQIALSDDSDPPGAPLIQSATHSFDSAWYSDPDPVFTLTQPEDPSGIAGYSYLLDEHAETVPDNSVDGTGTTVAYVSIQDGKWYFHCRAQDGAGNWGETNHYRIQIDTTPPAGGTILIEDDADTTKSLVVTLGNLQAEDTLSGMGSGAAMKFSNYGSVWSDEEPFRDTRTGWDLSQYGGNDSSGLKRVFVSFRDVAGNWSQPLFDEIIYSAPLVVETESLSAGTLGFAYAETLFASGGWPPYEWEIGGGALPPDLELDTTGIISGKPDSAGTFTFTVTVTDANMSATMKDYTITIHIEAEKGDVNGDADVNILDIIAVVRYILGLEEFTPLQIWAADVITDGAIDVTDILGIVNLILESPGGGRLMLSQGQALIGLEEDTRFPNAHNTTAVTLKSQIPVAGIQLNIRLASGSKLTRPPQLTQWSQTFQCSYKINENNVLLLLYSLSHEIISLPYPVPIVNLRIPEDAYPVYIESVIVADKNGQPITVGNDPEKLSSARQGTDVQSHPNPFNTETFLSFTLEKREYVTLSVYNVLGQMVRTLVSGECDPGEHVVSWDGTDWTGNTLPSGVYFSRIEVGNIGTVREMLLLK
ncbi:MAG: putative Ig domain-containing protein [Gemmatimonadota bacterium]|nr:MAG: putative Ig domain-containing protein [Gemmatimonadota bacterium]